LDAVLEIANTVGLYRLTPLGASFLYGQPKISETLLKKWNAPVSYPTAPSPFHQPVTALCNSDIPDAEIVKLLRLMLEKDRNLFSYPCFFRGEKPNPLTLLVEKDKTQSLEAALSGSSYPGVKELCSARCPNTIMSDRGPKVGNLTPAAVACISSKYAALSLILRHSDISVVEPNDIDLRSTGFRQAKPTIAEIIQQQADFAAISRGFPGPPRSLVTIVANRAKNELSAARASAAGAAATTSPAVASNAFEDPSVKVLSEKEAKKKAKKREQKKKAKAKKKAAASAAVGPGDAAGGPSDGSDSSGSDEEEEGLDEEEKMLARAPTFDLEKERAARRAAAAASTVLEEKKKEEE
jgi:hypothetical protein